MEDLFSTPYWLHRLDAPVLDVANYAALVASKLSEARRSLVRNLVVRMEVLPEDEVDRIIDDHTDEQIWEFFREWNASLPKPDVCPECGQET